MSDTPFPLPSPGNHVLASGSLRIPRFMLLESGGLKISPISVQDAGDYTCHAANAEGALSASATLTVWSKAAARGARLARRSLCPALGDVPTPRNL